VKTSRSRWADHSLDAARYAIATTESIWRRTITTTRQEAALAMAGLPKNGVEWPPKELHEITWHMQAWDAWYSGDPERLVAHYGSGLPVPGRLREPPVTVPRRHHRPRRPAIFWGQPLTELQRTKSHIPAGR